MKESNNILNYQIFLNALNNAIRADNKEIKTPLFICEMNNNANNKKYEDLPDNLKKLLFISTKKLAEFISIFEKNDNEKYFLHQEKLKSQIEGKKPGNNSLS